MKSTKIEDILSDEIEQDDTNINEIKQDDNKDELRDELENLKSELSMMKNDGTSNENIIESTEELKPTNVMNKNIDNHDKELGFIEKMFKLGKSDLKQIIILALLYVVTNSTQVNEMVDNMIPYSLYSYTFTIKLLLFIISFRILNLIDF